MEFIGELKRRGVIRVALAYAAGSWLIVQVAETVIEAYLWPLQWLGYLISALAIGFIPALAIAWAFELTPDGIVRDDGEVANRAGDPTVRRFDRIILVALATAVAYFLVDEIYFERTVVERSLAVLPFENLGGDDSQQYFADGVAGAVLQTLSEDRKLKVTSWSTSRRYRGVVDVPRVADELGVSYLVEGAVQKAGDSLRVSARLIDTAADAVIWSDDWNRTAGDVFAVQDEIARKVARNLRVELIRRHREARETDPETYDLYLQARKLWYESELNTTDRRREIALLDRVLERDPEFVPAMTLLAVVLQYAATDNMQPDEINARQQRRMSLIDRAYELDPEDGLATTYAGWNLSLRSRDIFKGVPYLETALRLEPSNPEILLAAAYVLRMLGRMDDAVLLLEESIRRHPACQHCYARLGQFLWADGHYREAQAAYRRRLALDTDTVDFGAHVNIAQIDIERGDNLDAALEAVEHYEPSESHAMMLRAQAADARGDHGEADRIVAETTERFGEDPFALARFYAARGDADSTLRWVAEIIESSPAQAPLILTDTRHAFVFDTPEWQQWQRAFGLHPEQVATVEFDLPEFD